MNPPPAITLNIDLPWGTTAQLGITIIDEPLFPTPSEPDQRRPPTLEEWSAVLMKLIKLDITSLTIAPPPATN